MKQQMIEATFCHEQGRVCSSRLQANPSLRSPGIKGIMRSAGKTLAAGVVIYASLASAPAFASTLYSQPPSLAPFNGTRDSHVDAGINDGSTYVYDYFVPTQSGAVSNISWQGDAQTNAGFTIQILPASLDSKGVPLTPATPDTAASNPAVSTITMLNNDPALIQSLVGGLHNFSVDLTKLTTPPTLPVNMTAGNLYWISIYSTGNRTWGWSNGSDGNDYALFYTTGVPFNKWLALPSGQSDRAFSLSSVPVPGAVWLFGSGLMGLLSFSRRKNKTANC